MTEEISTPVETIETDTSAEQVETTSTEPETVEETAEIKEGTDTEKEPEKVDEPKLYAGKYKSVDELEKGYQEAQKYVGKVAELEKRIKELTPKEQSIVDEKGQIDKNFEAKYKFDIDNQEFLAYKQLSEGLDIETRQDVENLLRDAKQLYFADRRAYNAKMAEVKQYFNTEIIEEIAQRKLTAQNDMRARFKQAQDKQRFERGVELCKRVEAEEELFNILNDKSENYIPEVFNIFRDTFDTYGSVDLDVFKTTINKVKELGVKEYLAKQELEKAKEVATVPTGGSLENNESKKLTSEQLESTDFWNKFYS